MCSAGRCAGHCATRSKSAYFLSDFARIPGTHSGKAAHHYATWCKHDHSVAFTCGACNKPGKEAAASSNTAMVLVPAEKVSDMQGVPRQQTKIFMAAMREQLQGTDRVPIRDLFERQHSLACEKWKAMDLS